MATYTKISELTAATVLDGTETIPVVQSSATVKATVSQIWNGAATAATGASVITGEYIFTEDSELDYSGSFTDGMSAQTITFSELPANTKAIFAKIYLNDTDITPNMRIKRTSGGTENLYIAASFADGGTNYLYGTWWLPTDGNSIYVMSCTSDGADTPKFIIYGYKVGT